MATQQPLGIVVCKSPSDEKVSDPYEEALSKAGFPLAFVPVIETKPIEVGTALHSLYDGLVHATKRYSGIVFTSAQAVNACRVAIARFGEGKTLSEVGCHEMQVYCVGIATKAAAEKLGFQNVMTPVNDQGTAEVLADTIISEGRRHLPLLLIMGEQRLDTLTSRLKEGKIRQGNHKLQKSVLDSSQPIDSKQDSDGVRSETTSKYEQDQEPCPIDYTEIIVYSTHPRAPESILTDLDSALHKFQALECAKRASFTRDSETVVFNTNIRDIDPVDSEKVLSLAFVFFSPSGVRAFSSALSMLTSSNSSTTRSPSTSATSSKSPSLPTFSFLTNYLLKNKIHAIAIGNTTATPLRELEGSSICSNYESTRSICQASTSSAMSTEQRHQILFSSLSIATTPTPIGVVTACLDLLSKTTPSTITT